MPLKRFAIQRQSGTRRMQYIRLVAGMSRQSWWDIVVNTPWNSMGGHGKVGHAKNLKAADYFSPPLGTTIFPSQLSSQIAAGRRRSARLLNVGPQYRLRGQKLRILLVPQMIAGTEGAEFTRERSERSGEFLGIDVHSHEHVMAG
jgi:hypothetical protein